MRSILNPALYIRRNPARVIPLTLVVALAVIIVYCVVTIVRTVNTTIFTLYGYNRFVAGVLPRNALSVADSEVEKVRKMEGLGILAETHNYSVQVKTIFGKMVFPLFGLEPEPRKRLMTLTGNRIIQGRMIEEGKAEVLLSADVVRNLGLKLGDIVSKPESEDNYAPQPIKIVGILEGDVWLGLMSKKFVDDNSPLIWKGYMVFAKPGFPQSRLDSALLTKIDKSKARIWTFSNLVKEAQTSLTNLYLILNLVVCIIMVAIAFVCSLLSNIYFTQRLPEIATLAAIGYSRKQLLSRAVGETFYICLMGWIVGMGGSLLTLKVIYYLLFAPKGLLLNLIDTNALLLTFPLPLAITVVAWVTITLRLKRIDPVSIIERRA
jgi:ABC-type lipoprotein release transport system permease subunit